MYTTQELAAIDCKIRDLATNHYKYGKSMPLVFGKARGISRILETHYDVYINVRYVWDVLAEMYKDKQKT